MTELKGLKLQEGTKINLHLNVSEKPKRITVKDFIRIFAEWYNLYQLSFDEPLKITDELIDQFFEEEFTSNDSELSDKSIWYRACKASDKVLKQMK